MSDRPTANVFAPHVGKEFRPRGLTHALTLVTVDTRQPPGWETAPSPTFSLLLRGPRGDVLPEGHYAFAIEGGHDAAFYIMPVYTPARTHQDYQAVFN